jgi:hypothetical protein
MFTFRPPVSRPVTHNSEASLQRLTAHFHDTIRQRAGSLIAEHRLELPSLEGVPDAEDRAAWFPIPGMYGGFKYWLENQRDSPELICESWCRVVAGSGQRHRITEEGAKLVDEGFV